MTDSRLSDLINLYSDSDVGQALRELQRLRAALKTLDMHAEMAADGIVRVRLTSDFLILHPKLDGETIREKAIDALMRRAEE